MSKRRKIDMALVAKGGKLMETGYKPKDEAHRVEILAALTELQRYMNDNRNALTKNIVVLNKRRRALRR